MRYNYFNTASIASLSVKPLNAVTAVRSGSWSSFTCQNNTNISRWVWTSVDGSSSCEVHDGYDYGACVTDRGKYYVTSNMTTRYYSLTIMDAQHEDAGTVFCEEFSENPDAGVAVFGVAG